MIAIDDTIALRWCVFMIKSFKRKETKKVFGRKFSKKLPRAIQRKAVDKLFMIRAARRIETLRIPRANKLEAPGGERAGQSSIRINDQWRIRFEWKDGDAYNVEIVDYH